MPPSPDLIAPEEPFDPAGEVKEAQPARASDMPRGGAGATPRIVEQAASILAEEVAAGLSAARRIGERFGEVENLRSGQQQEVMQRFRRDAHEVIDILLDLTSQATDLLGRLDQRASVPGEDGAGDNQRPGQPVPATSEGIPALTIRQPITPGTAAVVPMRLENNRETTIENLHFLNSDLISAGGERILAQHIQCTPASLVSGPGNAATVVVMMRVPEGTPAGIYSCLLQAAELEQGRAVLTVRVA